jgi:hypothetical protein
MIMKKHIKVNPMTITKVLDVLKEDRATRKSPTRARLLFHVQYEYFKSKKYFKYDKQDQQGKAAFNERNPQAGHGGGHRH